MLKMVVGNVENMVEFINMNADKCAIYLTDGTVTRRVVSTEEYEVFPHDVVSFTLENGSCAEIEVDTFFHRLEEYAFCYDNAECAYYIAPEHWVEEE